jgi:hypothetical protein
MSRIYVAGAVRDAAFWRDQARYMGRLIRMQRQAAAFASLAALSEHLGVPVGFVASVKRERTRIPPPGPGGADPERGVTA